MNMEDQPSVTLLLRQFEEGDRSAFDELAQRLYPELKRMARARVQSGRGMGATTLVQETFVKLLSEGGVTPHDRQQFFGLTATIMRQVMVDDARYAAAQKRASDETEYIPEKGSDRQQVQAAFLIQVDAALNKLAARDARMAKAFECRYFGGYSIEETAEILGLSVRSTERLWSNARSLMAQELERRE